MKSLKAKLIVLTNLGSPIAKELEGVKTNIKINIVKIKDIYINIFLDFFL